MRDASSSSASAYRHTNGVTYSLRVPPQPSLVHELSQAW